jgi:mono/diheme cytochrome c family protein
MIAAVVFVSSALVGQSPTVDFVRDVEPIFARACVSCHGRDMQKSGFRLDQKAAALKGGDLGVSIIPGKSEQSPLIRYVSGTDPDITMPPKEPRLTTKEIATLKNWIDQGAKWSASQPPAKSEETWWSLRPLVRPMPPRIEHAAFPIRNPIDAFVLAKLRAKNLTPSPEADRRTLIRRLSFDLLGLPPSADEIDAFVRDPSPRAYDDLVDRLLASPRYGERWARHWLDVVHYGETHGYDKDQPRPNAWPYRDYVIGAFNDDKPYRRFIEEQLAGDVLYPGTADGIAALGFIAAGPWDLIGHMEVPESKIDGKITRHLDRDDIVATTMSTFVSMTASCAQCHNHKFDPISMEDYYSLHAVFAAVDRADRKYFADPTVMEQWTKLDRRRHELEAELKSLTAKLQSDAELIALDRKIAALGSTNAAPRPEFGYHSAIAADASQTKWVQIDLGERREISSIVLTGAHDTFNNIGAGFGFPPRYKVEIADTADFAKDVTVVQERTSRDVPNPGVEPQRIAVGHSGRYVRITAVKLAPRQNDYIFALGEVGVHGTDGVNMARGKSVTAFDTIEQKPRWSTNYLVDGVSYSISGESHELKSLRAQRLEHIAKLIDPATRRVIDERERALQDVQTLLKKLPAPQVVYAGTVHHGSGPFAGTGASGGKPRPISILARGDVRKPGKEVGPGSLSAIAELAARFDFPAGHAEGERRAALARWIGDAKNPLTWRSIVNRVWLYHFGRGIVDSPSDFGRMGQLPTHPELHDWLAVEFRDGGQSFRKLHRLIVTSSTYRQSSADRPEATTIDSGNQYLWRMNRRRLDAEAIRDSILKVSGKLDLTMGGPSFQDFVITHPEHSPHYRYELHDANDPKSHRRSIYRFIVRSQQQPFLAALDCADPSIAVDKRNQTITPQQALALLNNSLSLAMAKHFAADVSRRAKEPAEQIAMAFRQALGRPPTASEAAALREYQREHGLANVCRLLMNLNEFVFVD